MSTQRKPSIVFVHGIWADGSSFSKLIPTLQAGRHEVIAAHYGPDTLAGYLAAVKSAIRRGQWVGRQVGRESDAELEAALQAAGGE